MQFITGVIIYLYIILIISIILVWSIPFWIINYEGTKEVLKKIKDIKWS